MLVFKLGGAATLPPLDLKKPPMLKPPPLPLGADAYTRAGLLYERSCSACHGVAAITGGVLPDLRRSARLQDSVARRSAVVGGELAALDMPRFERHLGPDEPELLRAYVAKQAVILYETERLPAIRTTGSPRK